MIRDGDKGNWAELTLRSGRRLSGMVRRVDAEIIELESKWYDGAPGHVWHTVQADQVVAVTRNGE